MRLPVKHATPLLCFKKIRKEEEVNREWGRTPVNVEDRDVLCEICGYMAEKVLGFIGCVASGVLSS